MTNNIFCIYESHDDTACIYSERVGEVFLLSLLLQEKAGLKTYLQARLTREELRKVEEGLTSLRDAFKTAPVCYLVAGENRATLKGSEINNRWLPSPGEYLEQ